jgi:hypothetical protein
MASRTAGVPGFAAFSEYVPVRMRANAADTFFRGALVFFNAGRIAPLVVDTSSNFAGIVAEHAVIAAQDEFVLVYTEGIFLLPCANFTIANQGTLFYQTVAGEDDPTTLTTTAAGNSGAVGTLIQVKTTAVDGWIDIGRRIADAQTA